MAGRGRSRLWARALDPAPTVRWDPGRNLRAERKAEELMLSIIGAEDFAMYRDLGVLQVDGATGPDGTVDYAYLIYPHRPIVSYDAATGKPLSEHCIEFPDRSEPSFGSRLPDADDVLAKWMSLHGDERGTIAEANMHAMGRQIDPAQARRDIERLLEWRRRRSPRLDHSIPTPETH